jgi:dolichyl-diphosphooligosaccharide--protein glycosyltransferase
MSQESEQVDGETPDVTSDSVARLFEDYYHLPALAAAMLFMLWARLQPYGRFVGDGRVLFSGNDAYYHYRQVSYTVRNWPWTMSGDAWTRFPYSTAADHFGTLYDQLIATAALVVGLGSPSQQTIGAVTVAAPAVFGALVALPVYYLGKRLSGSRAGGMFGVLVLALLPGTFLQRSTAGFADHHVAEVLFQALALGAFAYAVTVAERERPVYEQFLDGDWAGLRPTLRAGALAGVAFTLYVWAWPPGILLAAILALFLFVHLSADVLRGRSPEHVAIVTLVALAVTLLGALLKFDTLSPGTTSISLLHVTLLVGVAAGTVFMAGLARAWERPELDAKLYPVVVGAVGLVGFLSLSVAAPSIYSLAVGNARRILLFSQSKGTLTIAEAQSVPLDSLGAFLYREYGLAYATALGGFGYLLYSELREHAAQKVLVLVYSVFVLLMALTQIRFNYYLVIPVAALNALLFGRVVDAVGTPALTGRIGDVKGYQVLALAAVVLLVLGPLVPPLAAASVQESRQTGAPAWVGPAGQATSPGSASVWADSADWVANNTPDPGTYGDGGEPMAYYGAVDRTDDYQYPEGAYGVMSWWDYGHWITVMGERIPHANPFQQNARSASSFLQAQNESRANLVLDALPGLRGQSDRIDEMSDEDLAEVASGLPEEQAAEDVQYVMIDDQTAGEKFGAVVQWAGPGQNAYFQRERFQYQTTQGVRNASPTSTTERYEDTILYELYYEDATDLSNYRLVHENPRYSIVGGRFSVQSGQVSPLLSQPLRGGGGWNQGLANSSRQLTTARQRTDLRQRQGQPGVALPAGNGAHLYDAHVESRVKTFERVPGATVEGRLANPDPNATYRLSVTMRTSAGRPFDYNRTIEPGPDGSFSATVPYATDDALGPDDGYTDSAVEAVGNYSLVEDGGLTRAIVPNPGGETNFTVETRRLLETVSTFEVSERAVYGLEEGVDLGTVTVPESDEAGDGSTGGSGDGEATDGSGGDGGGDGGGGTDGSGGDDGGNTTGALAPPGVDPTTSLARP